jgi:hypothetical protein
MIPAMQVALFYLQAQTFRNLLAAAPSLAENGVVLDGIR